MVFCYSGQLLYPNLVVERMLITVFIWYQCVKCRRGGTRQKPATWALPQYKDRLSRYGIPMLKIRRSQDCLIFNMWIAILVRQHLHIQTALWMWEWVRKIMMTSSNGSIFRVTGHLCGEFTGEFPSQRPVTRSFDVFFDLRLNKRLSKQSWGWWFETLSRLL